MQMGSYGSIFQLLDSQSKTPTGGTPCKNDLKMSNYTPPKDWPAIRWIAFVIVLVPCWLFGWGAAKGFHLLIEKPFGENIITGLVQVAIYYGGAALAFVFAGIYVMACIEAGLKWLTNE